jgi:uncharacterized YigZ family protein
VFSSAPAEYVVERSRFIGRSFRLISADLSGTLIDSMRAQFPGANHYTWAYRITEAANRASDDGEPQGTAGLPMLNVLTREDWTETLVVVVRFFGGIKLGRGGLVHAYQKAAQLALENTTQGVMEALQRAVVRIDYSSYDKIMRAIEERTLSVHAQFAEDVTLDVKVREDQWASVRAVLEQETRGQWQLVEEQQFQELMPRNL